MTVFCDNGDCCYIGEDGFCGCDKLSIVGGVCAGSYRSGRNACDGDVDERLKVENAKLRELLGDALKTLFYKRFDGSVGCTENCPRWQFSKDCQLVDGCWLEFEAAKLGVEVDA